MPPTATIDLPKLSQMLEAERARLPQLKAAAEQRQAEIMSSLEVQPREGQTVEDARSQKVLMSKDLTEAVEAAWRPYGEACREVETMSANLITMYEAHGFSQPAEAPRLFGRDDAVGGGNPYDPAAAVRRMGARFTGSEEYRRMQAWARGAEGGSRLGSTDRVEVLTRAELMAITGASKVSAGAFVVNDRKDFLPLLRETMFTLSKVGIGETDSDTVEYVEQDGFTNAAAGVAEGLATAESTVSYVVRTTPVEEQGHHMKVTKRALADAGQTRTLLTEDLLEGLLRNLSSQCVSGSGVSPELRGILNTSGVQTLALGANSRADAIFKAITLIRIVFGEPDWIAFNPADYEDLRLQKDGMGRYLFGEATGPGSPTVWGIPWFQSSEYTAGTVLVGDFRAARAWIREGMSVDATDSDGTDFVKRIVTLQATARTAFKVLRANQFCTVTGF